MKAFLREMALSVLIVRGATCVFLGAEALVVAAPGGCAGVVRAGLRLCICFGPGAPSFTRFFSLIIGKVLSVRQAARPQRRRHRAPSGWQDRAIQQHDGPQTQAP